MKLGELFVDLNVNSGGAFNTLSGFAFKFGNIVDLAERANTFINNAFGNQAEWAHSILNTAQSLNISARSIQAIRVAAKELGVDWNVMTGKLKKLDEEYVRFLQGKNDAFVEKMKWFGLNPDDIRNSQTSLELMQKMIANSNKIGNSRIREAFRRQYGFDVDEIKAWTNYFKEREKYESHANILSDEELKKQDKIRQSIKNLDVTTDTMWNKIASAKADALGGIVDWLVRVEERFTNLIISAESFSDIIKGLPQAFAESDVWIERLTNLVEVFNKIGANINGIAAFLGVWKNDTNKNPLVSFRNAREAYNYAYDVSMGKKNIKEPAFMREGWVRITEDMWKEEKETNKSNKTIAEYANKIYTKLLDIVTPEKPESIMFKKNPIKAASSLDAGINEVFDYGDEPEIMPLGEYYNNSPSVINNIDMDVFTQDPEVGRTVASSINRALSKELTR